VKYLVDTNVISEIRKGTRGHSQVINWWNSIHRSQVFLSVLTIGEIHRGIVGIRRKDSHQANHLEAWLDGLIQVFGNRLIPIDQRTALVWAEICIGRTLPVIDSLMAATAISMNLTFVSRNTKDIQDCGVRYINPFEG
jgi:predicted nucleic acid-binding protein